MILTNEQIKEFKKVALPLMKWMKKNLHPHTVAIIDSTQAELLESSCGVNIEDDVSDEITTYE